MDVIPLLVADSEPSVFGKPRQRALHNPSVPPQLLRTFDPLPRYPNLYPALLENLPTPLGIVSLVGVDLLTACCDDIGPGGATDA